MSDISYAGTPEVRVVGRGLESMWFASPGCVMVLVDAAIPEPLRGLATFRRPVAAVRSGWGVQQT